MLVLFVMLMATAVSFTALFLLLLPGDRKASTLVRPLWVLTIAIIFWAATMPAFVAPDTSTVIMPSYTVMSNSLTGNTLYTWASTNVITNTNYPIAVGTFYIYMGIWIAILGIHLVLLIFLILEWIADRAEDAIMNTDNKR
jgi:hypothetical protein